MEFTVHFQKGHRVGTRSLHMVRVEAGSVAEAIRKAKVEHAAWGDSAGHRLSRVDHFDEDTGRLVIDQ
jgi:hypothetical protein